MHDLTRRATVLSGLALAACAPQMPPQPGASYTPTPDDPRFAVIERRIGGRVGVAALDTSTGDWIGHRVQERFAMCSTFKWLLAAHALFMGQAILGLPNRQLAFTESDLQAYAPTARQLLPRGWMSVHDACEAAVVLSDNTAANLLLTSVSSPASLTEFLRHSGDSVTRLDRLEPELNENMPDDPRDTSTPKAMVLSLKRLLLTDSELYASSRESLIGWMIESPTGRERLRAGLPPTWRVGDKTGTWTGEHNATNDVAIAWPPNRAPILIAAYLSNSTVEPAARNAAHAEIARIIVEQFT
jgi:beta-lactamase class A